MTNCDEADGHAIVIKDCKFVPSVETQLAELKSKYQRAVWFLQDIAAMSRKVGSETAAHALAQLGEPRERSGD